jgi:hypothetical protein
MKWRNLSIDPDAMSEWNPALMALKLIALVTGGIIVCSIVIAGEVWLVRLLMRTLLPG